MSEDAALIEQPEGSPGAVADAGTSLQRVSGGFERGGGVVARASSTVSGWEGRASVSFDGRAASYGLVMVAVEQALTAARAAVRRYETALEDARAKIRQLREQEDMAVARLQRAKQQLEEAKGRLAGAQERMSAASFTAGLSSEPFSMAESVQAGRDADEAQADIDAAQKQIDREREEIRELREDAKRERTQLVEAEQDAAGTVRAAAGRLPDVQLPGGAASPSAYAGTIFAGPVSPFERDPRWASAMAKAAANDKPEEPGIFAKAWDNAMENFGSGTPLHLPLAIADQVSPGFRSDFGRAVTEDLATGLYETGKMGVQLSPGYYLIDPKGSDRAARQAQAIIDYAREDTWGFAKDASGWSAVEAGHPGSFAGGLALTVGTAGAGGALRTTTTLSRLQRAIPEPPSNTTTGAPTRLVDDAAGYRGAAAGDTKALTANVERELGMIKPAGTETHHLVPKGEYSTRSAAARDNLHRAQALLHRFGIGPDEGSNGVFLPRTEHRAIHTDEYFRALNRELGDARSKEDAVEILADIRRDVHGGTFK